ncbi:MAG: hypothetical protein NTX64_18495 [Elusimicrobia bacterium]|nr:hypothetical protein [Elusimicrobiota bacterium]
MRYLPLVAILLLAAACRRSDIEVSRASKAPDEGQVSAMPPGHPAIGNEPAAAGGANLKWTSQPGWKSKPAGGMRLATFVVPTPKGEAELAVVVLSGNAGGALANVNRWRGQLGLPAIDDAGLKKASKTVASPAGTTLVVELVGADGKSGMLGSLLPQNDQTWFFKMTGPAAAVKSAEPSVMKFLASLR